MKKTKSATGKSILVAGSVGLDTVDTPFGNVQGTMGGATYAALAAALFADVRLLGVVGDDFPPENADALREHGVDLLGLASRPGRTFRWAAYYGYDLAQPRTVTTQLNVQEGYLPEVPEAFRSTPYLLLTPADPKFQLAVLEQMSPAPFTLVDTMGYWISRDADAVLEVVKRADAITVSESEARQLTGTASIISAARRLHALGPRIVIIRKGEYGTLMLTPEGYFAAPAFPVEEMKDPTGAGDTFAGGTLGALVYSGKVTPATLRKAVVYGAVLASYATENFGVARLLSLEPGEVMLRFSEMRNMTAFTD